MGAQSTLESEISEILIQVQSIIDSPQNTSLSQSRFTEVNTRINKVMTFYKNSAMINTTEDKLPVQRITHKNDDFWNSMTKSGYYFIDQPSDGITSLPEDSLASGFMFCYINPLTNKQYFQFMSIDTNYSYNLLIDTDNPPATGEGEWAIGGGGDVGASEASTYQFLLADSSFEDCYFDILGDEETIVGDAKFERTESAFSGTVGQYIQSPNIIETGTYKIFYVLAVQTGTDLTQEYTVDGGSNWIVVPDNGIVHLETATADFRVKYTWVDNTSIISSFGVLFNETGVSYYSNTKLFEKYEVLTDTVANTNMVLPNDKYFTADGKSLVIHKNRIRMWIGVDYQEVTGNTIKWLTDLQANDSILFEEQYGYVDSSETNGDRLSALEERNLNITSGTIAVANDILFADTTLGTFTVTLPTNPILGDTVIIHDSAGKFDVSNLNVDGNGKNIMGLNENLVLDIKDVTVKLSYNNSEWRLV